MHCPQHPCPRALSCVSLPAMQSRKNSASHSRCSILQGAGRVGWQGREQVGVRLLGRQTMRALLLEGTSCMLRPNSAPRRTQGCMPLAQTSRHNSHTRQPLTAGAGGRTAGARLRQRAPPPPPHLAPGTAAARQPQDSQLNRPLLLLVIWEFVFFVDGGCMAHLDRLLAKDAATPVATPLCIRQAATACLRHARQLCKLLRIHAVDVRVARIQLHFGVHGRAVQDNDRAHNPLQVGLTGNLQPPLILACLQSNCNQSHLRGLDAVPLSQRPPALLVQALRGRVVTKAHGIEDRHKCLRCVEQRAGWG